MKNRVWKKWLAGALVLVLAAGWFIMPAAALPEETSALSQAVLADARGLTLAKPQGEMVRLYPYADDEEVTFIITLEQASIAHSVPWGVDVQEFLQTSAGSRVAQLVEQAQNMAMAYFSRIRGDIRVERTFSVLMNGFAVRAPYGAMESLWEIPGVANVAVAQTYELPKTQAEDVVVENYVNQTVYSGHMMQSQEAAEAGYAGQGMVIAVLDSALDVTHPDFAVSPAKAAMDPQTVEAAVSSGELNITGDTENLYVSEKIPFAYDYAHRDTDVFGEDTHGTHVSGSAVGNSDAHKGVAPEAQLVFMKVFNDSMLSSDDDIIAALEDCAVLGVDVINMSLGTGGGFTYVPNYEAPLEVCRQLGIQVVAACGNDSDARNGLNNLGGNLGLTKALVSEPDTGFPAGPSTNPHALSVASAVRIYEEQRRYLLCGEEKLYYGETNPDTELALDRLTAGEYAYVMIPGYGAAEDYVNLDVTGKLVVVQRGQITFVDKEANAAQAGAMGMILVNNAEEIVNISLEGLLPTVMVPASAGQILESQEEKKLTLSSDQVDSMMSDRGGLMANGSSMGVAPDMTLKPEITAPGQGEFSAIPGGGYELQSGTSMATPQIAGASAILSQYLQTEHPDLTKDQLAQQVSTVLMNTAKLVTDEYGIPYTPRKQGSGMAQILDAIQTPAYVTVDGNDRPVAQLGSSETGSFSTRLTIHNNGDTAQTYQLSAISLVPKTETDNGHLCMSTFSRILSGEEFTVSFGQDAVTVPAGGSASVDATLQLTDAGKAGLTDYINGIYMDGYLILDSAEGIDLHVPYMGFYGDWHKLAIFDDSAYGDEIPSVYGSIVAALDASGNGIDLGVNDFDNSLIVGENLVSVGTQYMEAGYWPSFWYGLLRGARTATFEVLNENGEPLELYDPQTGAAMGKKLESACLSKSVFSASAGMVSFQVLPDCIRWLPAEETEQGLEYLPDGAYTVRVTAMPDGTEDPAYAQVFDQILTIDNQMPQVAEYEVLQLGDQRYLSVTMADNHLLMGAQLADEAGTVAYTNMSAYCAPTGEFLVNVTTLTDQGINGVRMNLCDYARNYAFSEVLSLDVTRVLPERIELVQDHFQCDGPQTIRLEVWAEPETVTDPVLTWTSDDETVATVTGLDSVRIDEETGKVYYLADVSVKNVTGQTVIRVTTEGGYTVEATIAVVAIDTTSLEALIRQAEALHETEYSVESWTALELAIRNAREALTAEPISREQLAVAEQLLQEALNNLEKAETPSEPAEPEETTEPEEPEEETTEPTRPAPPPQTPDTHDSSNLMAYLVICVLSLTAVCLLLVVRKKQIG